MEKIKKILAPTDFSELSVAGVRSALELAGALGAEVTVYHTVSTDELMHYDQLGRADDIRGKYEHTLGRFLEEHCADLLPLAEVHKKVELGAPEDNIVAEAKEGGMDLIVISTHGRTGLSHILLGSITERVVRHAPCPVLSIRPQERKGERVAAAA